MTNLQSILNTTAEKFDQLIVKDNWKVGDYETIAAFLRESQLEVIQAVRNLVEEEIETIAGQPRFPGGPNELRIHFQIEVLSDLFGKLNVE